MGDGVDRQRLPDLGTLPLRHRALARFLLTHLRAEIQQGVRQILDALPSSAPPGPAVGLRAEITGGSTMSAVEMSVDATGKVLNVTLTDDKGDATTLTPNGPDGAPATISRSSSDSSIATVDPGSGALTYLKSGVVTLSASLVDSTGTPLDGFDPATVELTLDPGTATTLMASVDDAPPVEVPVG
jgi:hypothetical protein